ncbi:alpha/beta hydrolase fold domain-containing protein [Nevskia ramosa]|uniref:alpha/beta hydrolase fold domain-containing protein n=1 Tax=Nevskia ramosa TaxID=64002 RepID=UPI003D134B28
MSRITVLVHLRALSCAILLLPSVAVRAADTAPDAIAFPAVSSAEPGSLVISASQMISGIDAPAPISVSGGSYSVNGGEFVSSPGTVINGSTVRLRQTASTAFYTSTSMKLTLGTPAKTYSFKVTTRKVDTVPDAFSFAPRSEAAFNSVQTSEPTTISGLEAPAAISVSSGSYSINGGEFTTAAGIVANNAQVRARGTASTGVNRTTTVAIKIGGISGTFKITTVKVADTTPNAFSFAPTANAPIGSLQTSAAITVSGINTGAPISVTGGSYSLNGQPFTSAAGTVNNGDSVSVQQTASSSFSTTTTAVLKIGTVSGSYAVTTAAADTTPDAFSFASTVDAPLGSTQTSEAISVSGITAPTPISIVGGYYSVGGGPFSDRASSVVNGATVAVQVLAGYGYSETRTATLTIGGVRGTYSVITQTFTADGTPDVFRFEPVNGVPMGSVQRSQPIKVSGINVAVSISVTGGRYQVNDGSFTSEPGQLVNGDQVIAEVRASDAGITTSTAMVSIGGISADFSATTVEAIAADMDPDAFTFTPTFDAAPGSTQTSALARVSGINAATPISVSGGRYSINGSGFSSTVGSVANGDSVAVERIASDQFATGTEAVLTIGSVSATYRVTTREADTTPDAFAFAPVVDAVPGSTSTSAAVSIGGIDVPVPVTIVGGQYSIRGSAFTDSAGEVRNGDSVRVRVLASAAYATTTSATLSVGGVSAAFNATTVTADTTPDAFGFKDNPAAFPLLAVVSEPVTVSGITASITASVSGGEYSVNGAPFLTVPGPVSNGDKVRLLVIPGANRGDVQTATLSLGSVSGSFTVTADAPADDFPDVFEFRASTGPRNSAVRSESIRIRGINVPTPISVSGGTYSINGAAFTSAASTVRGNDVVTLQVVTGNSYNIRYPVTLTVGSLSDEWSLRTENDPTRLQSFTLVNGSMFIGGAAVPGSVQTTVPLIVYNPPSATAISVTGGSYSINDGPFTSAAGTVVTGDKVVVQFLASTSFQTQTSVTLRIGSISSTLSVTSSLDPVANTPTTDSKCASYIYRDQAPVPLRLFICNPIGWRATDRRSALVHWFGGGFLTGNSTASIGEAQYWARTYGMVGIAPDYRVNDRFGTYAYVSADDGRAALKWVQEHAGELGIDPSRIVLSGASAGGGVAFFAALRDAPVTGSAADNPGLRAAAVVTRVGVPDTTTESHASDYSSASRFADYGSTISPSLHIDAAFPPVLMDHGTQDTTVAPTPSIDFCSALIRIGRICEFNSKPGLGHDLSAGPNRLDEVHEDTRVFLTKLGLLPALR